jgi:hypothetical protein
MNYDLVVDYVLTLLEMKRKKEEIIVELQNFSIIQKPTELVNWIWDAMNEMISSSSKPQIQNTQSTVKPTTAVVTKTIDLRAIKRSSVDNDSYQNTKKKSSTEKFQKKNEQKVTKSREVKVDKSNQKDPFPNFLITVPGSKIDNPSSNSEPPSKKRRLSTERTTQNGDLNNEDIESMNIKSEDKTAELQKADVIAKQKVQRCAFFPGCTKQSCPYFHPTEPCKNPLTCVFGPKMCRYIHPTCKFGSRCTRPDCVYSHPRESLIDCRNGFSCIQKDTCTYRHPLEACIYNPKCRNQGYCTFSHAPPCQFGAKCTIPGCTFAHKSVEAPTAPTTANIIPTEDSINLLSDSLPKTPPLPISDNNFEDSSNQQPEISQLQEIELINQTV